jgi:hypothetical protein
VVHVVPVAAVPDQREGEKGEEGDDPREEAAGGGF